jgi:HNH endonuclease
VPRNPPADEYLGARGEIVSVTGRRAKGGRPGLPAIDKITLRHGDGTVLEFETPSVGTEAPLDLVTLIFAQSFPVCPICLTAKPTAQEHVPQGPLGGRVMTTTCAPCNNRFGSRVEAELQDWFDHALVNVAFEHEDIPGRRRVGRLLYRRGPSGFGIFPEGKLPPGIERMLRLGTVNLHFRVPDPQRYRLAVLKHAYLAACLYLGYVPAMPEADEIRAELVAVRDAPRRSRPPTSEYAQRLRIYRSYQPPQGPPLAIVATQPDKPDEDPEYLISLAGTLFVSWPFAGVPPRKGFQRVPMFG